MCQLIRHYYRHCYHHHHWELANACCEGFNADVNKCNILNHQEISRKELPPGEPLCCLTCLNDKLGLLKQAFYVMLIRLKAATMVQPPPAYSLERRWQRWKTQSANELLRTVRQYGYETPDRATTRNIEGNLFDAGWHFPVPAAELAAQMRDLNERSDRRDLTPERDFWLDRPSSHNNEDEEMAEDDDDAGSDDSGWGENDCVCGQDPCECPDEVEEDIAVAQVSEAVIATREILNRIRNDRH